MAVLQLHAVCQLLLVTAACIRVVGGGSLCCYCLAVAAGSVSGSRFCYCYHGSCYSWQLLLLEVEADAGVEVAAAC